ncbi:MAG TPA: efflux RND transporter periplasmic adaptor subunit [Chryseosolibacter sp.]|nr:efflux RND transporter periplasmic adaptor subunit [Chryseosolibacter sp.]
MKTTTLIFVSILLLTACVGDERNENASHDKHVVNSSSIPATGNNYVMLTDSQIKLANITLQKVRTESIGQTVILNGSLTTNEKEIEVISARVAGRIENLYVKETGKIIRRGEPVYTIYSEELITLQREYLLAREQYEKLGNSHKKYRAYMEAAKGKLLLYGLTEAQLQQLVKEKTIDSNITFISPSTGIVKDISITEGQHVSEGMQLMRIEDLETLWIEAELYPSETSIISIGSKIEAMIAGSEKKHEATITFLSPEYRNNSFITIMRASLPNPNLELAPGMQAQIYVKHSAKKALTVSADAVIHDEYGSHVYVKQGTNTFRPQMIETGIENFESIEVVGGLTEEDTVAGTGAYLLYSEMILKNGSLPLESHSHQ